MRRIRVIPALLLERGRLVKTMRFAQPSYVGDPINTVKILNDKQVDELMLLDIGAARRGTPPDLELIAHIASECFMPLTYGGGIADLATARSIFAAGVEKVVLNSALVTRPDLVREISNVYGSQAVVASIDAKRGRFTRRYAALTHGGTRKSGFDPVGLARRAVELGAGEVMIASIDRDGTLTGYDYELIGAVSDAVDVPVIASGGASSMADFVAAVRSGHASAVAAGALFVYNGPHRAVLVSYPSQEKLQAQVYSQI